MTLTHIFPSPVRTRSLCHDRLSSALEDANIKEQAMSELESQREVWENRCFKLRVYMRKLTAKCEEWETAFDQQAKLLEALNSKYRALKNSRTETLEVSALPKREIQILKPHALLAVS